ncbi:MAG: PQQ-like beta-propeller repeat protein [Deltaproteobacteria bacterium]|nr:PQQ-like beta-propeller repeat protein [Deltaproteobacteria bacterium]
MRIGKAPGIHGRNTATLALAALLALGCTPAEASSPYGVPLAPDSPWPKFRRDARQQGRADAAPRPGGRRWSFPTGKGIFSSPVVAGDGTVYVGSADRTFYALRPDGTQRWSFATGEIIDSSALLDDAGRVIFGSGDGRLYALDAADGRELWRFEADDPSVNDAFINWFEGNVAVGPNGDLYAPNDNFFVYALDRTTGAVRWRLELPDQTWSLAAVDPDSGRLYFGNNNLLRMLGDNLWAMEPDGTVAWTHATDGTIAASPLLTADGLLVVGGFDGYLRAYDAATGTERWTFAARDHLYASPAQLADGTLVQPAADGTVYALDPADGSPRWAFDAREPIRSSPAVDGDGRIWFGAGDGRLYALNPDGTLHWSLRLIDEDRNDLNGSPALGADAVYIAGENGGVHSVPYDWCDRPEQAADPDCTRGPAEDLPTDGAFLLPATRFGSVLLEPPDAVDAHDPLVFALFVRADGDTRLALVDSATVAVTLDPPAEVDVEVSGDRRFLTVTPRTCLAAGPDGTVRVQVTGDYREGFDRRGLLFTGGTRAGSFAADVRLTLRPDGPAELPLPAPAAPGDPSGTWELYRLAAPLPAILPSYNQIGFDSLHYLLGRVEPGVTWVVGALPGADGAVPDPATRVRFPLVTRWDAGRLTLSNTAGFGLEVMGVVLAFERFRISAALGPDGSATGAAAVVASTRCATIEFYGMFLQLLGLCNPDTDVLHVSGAVLVEARGTRTPPPGLGAATFELTAEAATVRLAGSTVPAAQHVWSILLLDAADGTPLPLDYGLGTAVEADAEGRAVAVTLALDAATLPPLVRAWLILDTTPAARAELTP